MSKPRIKDTLIRKVMRDQIARHTRLASILDYVIRDVIRPSRVHGNGIFGSYGMTATMNANLGTVHIATVRVDEDDICIKTDGREQKFRLDAGGPRNARKHLKEAMEGVLKPR